MATMNCPECGHIVSDLASSCPNCGCPLKKIKKQKKKKSVIPGIILIIIGVCFLYYSTFPKTTEEYQDIEFELIKLNVDLAEIKREIDDRYDVFLADAYSLLIDQYEDEIFNLEERAAEYEKSASIRLTTGIVLTTAGVVLLSRAIISNAILRKKQKTNSNRISNLS